MSDNRFQTQTTSFGEEHETNRLARALQLGFFAGLIWGGVRILLYYLDLTQVLPGFLVEPFFEHDFLAGTGGYMVGWLAFTALSMVASVIYAYLFSKLKGPWPGMIYGLVWFGAVYLLIGPLVGMLRPIGVLDWDSIWTDGCVFLLWGVFIGYTLSYEYTNERDREKKKLLNLH